TPLFRSRQAGLGEVLAQAGQVVQRNEEALFKELARGRERAQVEEVRRSASLKLRAQRRVVLGRVGRVELDDDVRMLGGEGREDAVHLLDIVNTPRAHRQRDDLAFRGGLFSRFFLSRLFSRRLLGRLLCSRLFGSRLLDGGLFRSRLLGGRRGLAGGEHQRRDEQKRQKQLLSHGLFSSINIRSGGA